MNNAFTIVELSSLDGEVGLVISPAYTNVEAAKEDLLEAVKADKESLEDGWVADESELPDYYTSKLDNSNWYELHLEEHIVKDRYN